ncbi:MAG: hypothetical protein NUV91_05110, partial [Candidatus Omnitrophica bacterium]|nr:hypothetical protein [Candidatus Omnitrophota bacterium]
FDAVQRHIEEAIRIMRDVDVDAMDRGNPVADMINQDAVAIDVLRRLIADREVSEEIEEFYLALQEGKNGDDLKKALKQDYLKRLSRRFGFDLTDEQYSYDTGRLARLLETRPQVTAEELQMIGRLEELSEREEVGYGLTTIVKKEARPFYEELKSIFSDLPDGERIAATLAQMRPGSLQMLGILGVLSPGEVEILSRKSEVDLMQLERMSEGRRQDLNTEMSRIVAGYEKLGESYRMNLLRRLVPMGIIDVLSDYFNMPASIMRSALTQNQDFWGWAQKSSLKVNQVAERVGGRWNAWQIVTGQGADKVDEWLKTAENKVNQITEKVGARGQAWQIVIAHGLKKVDDWLKKAEDKVSQIEKKVGGRWNAWQIVIKQGVDKVDGWLNNAEAKVNQVEKKVGGRWNAWRIVTSQGVENVDTWLITAEDKVSQIAEKVGGRNSAWRIVMGQGLDNVDNWLILAEDKVKQIRGKVGGQAFVWEIVTRQGLENVDEWLIVAENKVKQIERKVGNQTLAWGIVTSQGIDNVDDWLIVAEAKVNQIIEKGVGKTHAWQIMIGQGMENIDTWIELAQDKVNAIKDLIGAESYAWAAVIRWGVEKVWDEVERRQPQVDEIMRREEISRGQAWLRVMGESEVDEDVAADRGDDKTPPKPEFGFGGNAVDGEIVLAQRAAEAGDFDAVQ